jgi:O-antigen ligase
MYEFGNFNDFKLIYSLRPFHISWIFMMIGSLNFSTFGVPFGNMVRLISLFMAFIFIIIYFLSNKRVDFRLNFFIFILFSYLCFNFLSTIYSLARLETIFKCLELSIDILILICLMQSKKIESSFKVLFDVTISVIFITLLLIWIGYFLSPEMFSLPSVGLISKSLGNTLLHPNSVGSLGSLLLVLILTNRRLEKHFLVRWLLISFCFATLLFSQSRTGIVILIVCTIVALILEKRFFLLTILTTLGSILYFKYYDVLYYYILRGQSEGNFRSLSGRTILWEAAYNKILASPVYGYGFGTGSLSILEGSGISSLHNGFLEVLIGTGIIGLTHLLLILVGIIFLLVKRLIFLKKSKDMFFVQMVIIFIYLIIRTITSMGFGGWHSIDFLLFLLLIIYLSVNREISEKKNEKQLVSTQKTNICKYT